MLRSHALSVATVLCPLALTFSGCGGDAAQSMQDTPQAAVVREFLRAVQKGDRDAAKGQLTAKAVQAFAEHDVPFLPTAITSGTFKLGRTVEQGDTSFVQCVWTDLESGPNPRSEKIQWMVKKESGAGWRIYGLAVFMEAQGENLVLNFENPRDLIGRQPQTPVQPSPQSAASAPPQQAALPQDPFQSAPR